MKSKMSKAQQFAAAKHARHKRWQDEAEVRRAQAILERANDKTIVRKLGRGLREWAERVLANEKGRT